MNSVIACSFFLSDYRRAATGMGIIGLLVATIANSFSYYSIVQPRYIVRRLAGCMQLGTGRLLSVCNKCTPVEPIACFVLLRYM